MSKTVKSLNDTIWNHRRDCADHIRDQMKKGAELEGLDFGSVRK